MLETLRQNILNGGALPWIVAFPLLSAVALGLFGNKAERSTVRFVAVGSVFMSFLLALASFVLLYGQKNGDVTQEVVISNQLWEWFHISIPSIAAGGATTWKTVPVNVRLMMDSLSSVMTLVVTGIGTLIHLYSVGYMSEEKSYSRFFSYLNLFTASMLILVLASSFPLLFVGWEGVGLCSYLLIGFWYENSDYAAAGRKAFIANRVGDFGVILGMFILMWACGSFEFSEINANAGANLDLPFVAQMSIATVACLFLFLGCTGKSAQIPLFVWLPDAMAGPTPVSALIHAATMVTAGVYLCCRLSPVFLHSGTAMSVIAIVGATTALMAACVAVVQNEMKKILAYSTVSQLGFMFAAVGVGAFAAGFFHVFTHAFFKACLFLGAGSVMHAVGAHGDANIFKLGGLRKILPKTHATFLVACIAIAGLPGFAGFFSKDEILLGATTVAMAHGVEGQEMFIAPWVGWYVFVALLIAALMTAFYMFRLYFLTFTGEYRSAHSEDHGHEDHGHDDHGHDDHGEHGYDAHPHESPASMTIPLIVLAFGSAVLGWLGMPHFIGGIHWWPDWMSASITSLEGAHQMYAHAEGDYFAAYVAAGFGTFVAIVGVFAAYVVYDDYQVDEAQAKNHKDRFTAMIPAPLHSLLFDKWRIDELYDATIIGPIKGMARIAGWVDSTFVDTLLTKVTSLGVASLGWVLTRAQNGVVHMYGLVMILGVTALGWWFMYPHAQFEAKVSSNSADFVAGSGIGYQYRWDFDSDGEFDVPKMTPTEAQRGVLKFGKDQAGTHPYSAEDYKTLALLTLTREGEPNDTMQLGKEWEKLPTGIMGDNWRRPIVTIKGQKTPEQSEEGPLARVTEDGRVELRPNAANVTVTPGIARNEEGHLLLQPGHAFQIGLVPFAVGAVVEATLEVKNAFGRTSTEHQELVLRPPASSPVAMEVRQ